ncbi:MAG: TlpA family protein disulfide reductase [FCB group bacterium]|nr:TlpA family protein disulfide reductase [FCB group bacterium]
MKRGMIFLFIFLFMVQGCGHLSTPKKDADEFNYDNVLTFIMRNQKRESEELYTACEQILPLIVKEEKTDDYRKVIVVYNNNPDIFSKAMTLGLLYNEGINDPVLRDSLFAASGRAVQLSRSEAFFEGAAIYYEERAFSEDELHDRVTILRARIGDRYGQMLTERRRYREALEMYESIVAHYKDADILIHYAIALNNMNRYEESLIISIEALKMTPGSLEAKSRLIRTAELLGYSRAEINTMVDETVFVGRNILRQNLLADELNIPMPSFDLRGVNGEQFVSEQFRNKILIINFFATWCPPCRKELPLFNDLYAKFKDDPLVGIFAVSIDEDTFLVPPFIRDYDLRFPVMYADGINRVFDIKGVPTIVIVDHEGIIRYKKVGYAEGEEFDKIMSWYIEEIKAAWGV